jgi:hypothetical protein
MVKGMMIMRHSPPLALIAAVLALAACQPGARTPPEPADSRPVAEAGPAQPSGPARTVAAEEAPMPEAWVTDVRLIKDAGIKLFSTAGGDPAINGLFTYLAVYTQPEGWTRVYMIGDFNAWEVIEESASRVVLRVSRSWVEEASGEIRTAEEKLIIDVPEDPEAPIKITPAT